jgi:hypothetical protein
VSVQLDQTHIVVRLRTMSEIGDLALVTVRRYPGSGLAFAAGAVLWAAANMLLLGWIPIVEYGYGLDDQEAVVEIARYGYWMTVLVILQTPAAGALMTSYLGQAVFEPRPVWHSIWLETRRHMVRWLWVLGVQRWAIPAMLIVALRIGQPASSFWDLLIPSTLLLIALLVRSQRPFMPEILLLERCPLRTGSPTAITVRRRSQSLHRPLSGDLLGRFIMVSLVMVAMFCSLFYAGMFVRGIIIGRWNLMDLVVLLGVFPLALWGVAALSVLVRFLLYLDTRIRLEGWEVELATQAEAMRQFGEQPQLPATRPGVPMRLLMSLLLFATIAGALSCGASPVSGQELPPADRALEDSLWFDSDQNAIVPIHVDPQLEDSINRDSRWLPTAKKIKQSTAPVAPTPGTGFSFADLFSWTFLIIVLALVIGLLIWAIMRVETPESIQLQRRSPADVELPDARTIERIKHLPPELRRTDVNLRSEAERLMRAKQYDQAIILLFGHQLLFFDQMGWLTLNRGKTNRKYIREAAAADRESSRTLQATVGAFERSYFGRHSIGEIEFNRLWEANAALEEKWRQQPVRGTRSEVAV